jgi:hypothetical protein
VQGIKNIAMGMKAIQSSEGGSAGLAIDGDASKTGKCAYTKASASGKPWWRLDLKSTQPIRAVSLFPGAEEMKNIKVVVSDDPNNLDAISDRCGEVTNVAAGKGLDVQCSGKSGRYISVQLLANRKSMKLCEVKVFDFNTMPGTPAHFKGCYRDGVTGWGKGDRDLPNAGGVPGETKKVKKVDSFEACAKLCSKFRYFGMQNDRECFCGNSYGKQGLAKNCQCNSPRICGKSDGSVPSGECPAGVAQQCVWSNGIHKKPEDKWNGYLIKRVQVKGEMISQNIIDACKKHKMVPVCDAPDVFDAQCAVITSTNVYVSNPKENQDATKFGDKKTGRALGANRNLLEGAFLYSGSTKGRESRIDNGFGHRWSESTDVNMDTLCTPAKKRSTHFKYTLKTPFKRTYQMDRMKVIGKVTSDNIVRTCASKGLMPLCDHRHFTDGRCISAGGKWHYSLPADDEKHGAPVSEARESFFYNKKGGPALINTGANKAVKRTNAFCKNGYSFCTKPYRKSFVWRGLHLQRVKVNGVMNSKNILKACAKKKMYPGSDERVYFTAFGHSQVWLADGRHRWCLLLWSMCKQGLCLS